MTAGSVGILFGFENEIHARRDSIERRGEMRRFSPLLHREI